jgi:hypothetical protein
MPDGRALVVESIRTWDEDATVYNLSIENLHTFFVGAVPVLVHNMCAARGSANFIEHDPAAVGPHSVFNRDSGGSVTQYKEFAPNPQNPSGWDVVKRYDATGNPHFNKATQQYVWPPHVHDPSTPGKIRPPWPSEVP